MSSEGVSDKALYLDGKAIHKYGQYRRPGGVEQACGLCALYVS